MNEPVNKRAVAVGIFILVGLLFLVGGILVIGDLHSTFTRKINISTVFPDIDGLQAGDNIWYSGMKIGTVKALEFYGQSEVKVIMNISSESEQYIRKDAKVKIGSDGLIGNKILIIYGGTLAYAAIVDGDTLTNEAALSTEDILLTLQQNNLNILALTTKLNAGEGTIGKLLNSDSLYNSINASALSLQIATAHAQVLLASLVTFGTKLNQDGTLINDLVTDTLLFSSMQASIQQLENISDTAAVFINNLKESEKNPNSTVGVLLHDEVAGASLKTTITNLESSSVKLDENLEALKHSIFLRRYFKKEEKKKNK